MKIVKETPGTELDSLLILEPILFTNISGQILNDNKYSDFKREEISLLLFLLADSFKYDLSTQFGIIQAQIHLTRSIYAN